MEKANINHISYLSALLHTSVMSTKGILVHLNTRLHISCCRAGGKGGKYNFYSIDFCHQHNTNTKMQAVLLVPL